VKSSAAANLALMLVCVGWLLAAYGALSSLGDPDPHTPRSVLEHERLVSIACLLTGVLSLLGSVWLSGYAFAGAKWRAILAAALVVVPAVALYFQGGVW
jgi:hypothetical protein